MFEGEVQTAGIRMEFILNDSFKKLNIDWVRLDPSRVLQVSRPRDVFIRTLTSFRFSST